MPPTWLIPLPAGDYAVEIGGDLAPFNPPALDNYIVTVDATRDGAVIGHWERSVSSTIIRLATCGS